MAKCSTCDNDAVCVGGEWMGEEWMEVFGCDVCCAHGGEDFQCEDLDDPEYLAAQAARDAKQYQGARKTYLVKL